MTHATPRFLDLTEGCIRDARIYTDDAGLRYHREWTPTLNPDGRVDHASAIKLAGACVLLGGGWALAEDPYELASLVDYGRCDPAIDTDAFPDTKSSFYWTGKPHAANPDWAWGVGFGGGYVDDGHRGNTGYVRAVRRVPAGQ